MLLDAATGTLHWAAEVTVPPALTRAAFEVSARFAEARPYVKTGPHASYFLPPRELEGKHIGATLFFGGERLEIVSLSFTESGDSWENWSREKIGRQKAFQDDFLEQELGTAGTTGASADERLWVFPWGLVSSLSDARGGFNSIIIRYARTVPVTSPGPFGVQ